MSTKEIEWLMDVWGLLFQTEGLIEKDSEKVLVGEHELEMEQEQ